MTDNAAAVGSGRPAARPGSAMTSASRRPWFRRSGVAVVLTLVVASCSSSGSSTTTGAPEAGASSSTEGPVVAPEVTESLLSAIAVLQAGETATDSRLSPLPPLDVEDWLWALPWQDWIGLSNPDQVAADIHRATLEYLGDRAPRPGSDAAALMTAQLVSMRQSGPDLPGGWNGGAEGDATTTVDQATALVREEMHAQSEATDPESGGSVRIGFDVVIEHYACWDPGQPQQRSASIDSVTFQDMSLEDGQTTIMWRTVGALTEYVGGGDTYEVTHEFRNDRTGISGSITLNSGPDPGGNPFEGDPSWTREGDGARGEFPGGGSAELSCSGTLSDCSEQHSSGTEKIPDAVYLMRSSFDGEPGGDDFCLVPEIDPATATLAPGGDEVELTLRVRNWNDEPIEGAEVTARLTSQLGMLAPLEGGTDQEGAFRSTYTTADAGRDRALFDFEYSFYEWGDQADLEIQNPWKLQMTMTRREDGDEVVWFYEADFGADADGLLVGSGSGQINGRAHCVSESEGYSGPFFVFAGTFSFEIRGSLTDEVFDLEVTGSNAAVKWLETPSDPMCGEAFFDMVTNFVGAIAELPLHQLVAGRALKIAAEHGTVITLEVTDLGTLRVAVYDNDQLDQ